VPVVATFIISTLTSKLESQALN